MDLGYIFGGRSREKSRKNCAEKHAFFGYRFFGGFFGFLAILLGFWDAPGLQKIEKKFKKIRKNQFFDAFSFEGEFWDGSGAVLGGF